MSLYATETIPQPMVLEAVVITDALASSVGVRLPETAGGGERHQWRQAHNAMRQAVENGWANHPYVYASTPSASDAVHMQPANFSMLTAHFPVGVAGFSELVSKPVYALVSVDRNSGRFVKVSFLNRP